MYNPDLLTDSIKSGNRDVAKQQTQQGLDEGVNPDQLLAALVAGMDDVGRRFKANEIFVPEVLIAGRAMKEAMAVLEPSLVASGYEPQFKAVIGTVQGDLHDIGKNLVAMMWKGANIGVIDLGTNVPPEKFVAAAHEQGVKLIGLSALLTTTMPSMKKTIELLKAEQLGDVKVLIGGAPITQSFADEIGADGFAADAGSAVDMARELVPA